MVASLIFAAIVLGGPLDNSSAPQWFDQMLAGYAFAYDEDHPTLCTHDPKSGFYLVRTVVCDGGDLDVVLTRDRNYVSSAGFYVPGFDGEDNRESGMKIKDKPLPSLSTGKGVKIGDTEAQVTSRLGHPKRKELSGSRSQFMNFIYSWHNQTRDDSNLYEETYTFKAGKLIEVTFDRTANDF